jgi:hypothetical protein
MAAIGRAALDDSLTGFYCRAAYRLALSIALHFRGW